LTHGVLLVEAIDDETRLGELPILTGRFVVVSDEAFKRVFTIPVPSVKIACTEFGVIDMILPENDFMQNSS
jgi:hypothetical protein